MLKKILIVVFIILLLPLKSMAKTFDRNVNIAFTIDNNYPIFTLLVINSIMQNNISGSNYTFYIVENNITKENKEKMKYYVSDLWGQNINFIHLDTKIIDGGADFFKFSKSRITPIGMARIMLPKLLPEDVHRVIYLDGDILVTDDISKLYNMNLKNNPAGLVANIVLVRYDMYKFKRYFNSGVIVMDVDKWRKENISDQLLTYLKSHTENFMYKGKSDGKTFLYPDQDLINIVLYKRITPLPINWNNQTMGYDSISDSRNGIYHYIGPIKPWDFPIDNKSAQMKLYYTYWDNSPLHMYRYKYSFLSFQRLIKLIIRNKINRYKNLFKHKKKKKM